MNGCNTNLDDKNNKTRKHSSRMRTDCAVTRPSSEPVSQYPWGRLWTDRHLWKHYLPLRSVIMHIKCELFLTTCKRSCEKVKLLHLSVCPQGVLWCHFLLWTAPPYSIPLYSTSPPCTAPAPGHHPHPRVKKQAVCILLECFPVFSSCNPVWKNLILLLSVNGPSRLLIDINLS